MALALTGLWAGLAGHLMSKVGVAQIRLDVQPRVCFAPCSVRVRVQVTPEEDNRKLVVRMSGERYESSSEVQLEGKDSPKTFPFFWFKDLPSGVYAVEAFVQDYRENVTAHEQSTVEVGGF